MTRSLQLAGVLGSLLFLTACGSSSGGGGGQTWAPPEFETVTAVDPITSDGRFEPVLLSTGFLEPRSERRYYRVEVPASLRQRSDVVYFEVTVGDPSDPDPGANALALRLHYSDTGNVAASSGGPYGFSAGNDAASFGPQSMNSELTSQSIGVPRICLGPCIVWPNDFSFAYISIENRLEIGTGLEYALYAYVDEYQDTNEPENDFSDAAVVISASESTGAIETLWDEDYWRVPRTGILQFESTASEELQLRARVGSNPSRQPLAPGDEVRVNEGDLVRVYSASDWAGPAGVSDYSFELR